MNAAVRWPYAAAMTLARAASRLAPATGGKVARSLRARQELLANLQRRASAVRDTSRPLLWLHAPSVGEGLQARPIAHAWREVHPDWQIAYSFYSPSAERFAESVTADITSYLPFDTARDMDAMLDVLRPSLLVFAKLDVWPVLVERAVARGIPVAMISATLSAGSGRSGWWSRQLLHDAYASLRAVGAIDSINADRLVALGVSRAAVRVTGDTRFDQVAARAAAVDRSAPLLAALASSRPTLVAGSTWPADEAVLLPAWSAFRHAAGALRPRLIIAPHEPVAAHCDAIHHWAMQADCSLVRLSSLDAADAVSDADVVLVDRVGVLGDLYALAQVAYVGGGFHRAGLHSVIEPAAFGVPVLFGPGHHMSREAGLLLDVHGAVSVRQRDDLTQQLGAWLMQPDERAVAGAAARALVERERGATERSLHLLESLVNAP